MKFLEVQNVTKKFNGFTAIANCDIQVPKNEITGLIGPNGAGKTTLFNCISSFLPVTDGNIYFKEENITDNAPHNVVKKGIARTFQVPHGFKKLTVMENVMAASLENFGDNIWQVLFRPNKCKDIERNNKEKALYLLKKTQLLDRKNDQVGNLTSGEAKMLELARQLMLDPEMLLLDEPAAGVNPTVQEILSDFIIELYNEGLSFLIIDHNLEFITKLSHHIYVMNAGKIFLNGTPEEVMNNEDVKEIYLGSAA